jgi:ribose-phosphate pyrophosphokinase
MFLISGSASKSIANDLSKIADIKQADVDNFRFPDGELYIRIKESVENEEIIIIQTTYPDEKLIELFLILDACRQSNTKKITVVIPYFGYARQDKQFKSGEPISASLFASLISKFADEVITIDLHKQYITDFFSIPIKNISAIPAIADYLHSKKIDLVLAPDKGAFTNAKKAAEILKCDVDYLEKTRIDGTTIKIAPKNLDVTDKKVAIIDDIISTGGTMATAIKELKNQHAAKVYVACTHGLFAGSAIEKLSNAHCDEIIATDTIESKYSKVKMAQIISNFL